MELSTNIISDEENQRRLQAEEQKAFDLSRLRYKKVLRDKDVRSVLWEILAGAKLYHACMTPEEEGRRRYGLEILEAIEEGEPGTYLKMQKENLTND